MSTPILTDALKEQFNRDGFLIVSHPQLKQMRMDVIAALKHTTLTALARMPEWADDMAELEKMDGVDDILTYIVSKEGEGNPTSSLLYRLFVNTPELIGLINNKFLLQLSQEVGVASPFPSTMPITRIDRPGDTLHKVPPHQDYWYSLMSENCVTIWFTYGALEADMGILEVVPGSHDRGLIPFTHHSGGPNPFTALNDDPDENYIKAVVPEDAVLIFNQKLLHRSGYNQSQKVRTSIQVRYNDLENIETIDSTYKIVSSGIVEEKQEKLVSA